MWAQHLRPEWERVKQLLQDAVKACQQLDLSGMNRIEAAQLITGQTLEGEKWKTALENGEQRSQDLMQQLDLSQSAASRHLKQLSATGYLSERRCNGAKCYTLNPDRIANTLKAVEESLLTA